MGKYDELLKRLKSIAGPGRDLSEKAIAAIRELEADAKRWKGLKELCGYWQDGSETTVKLWQDDATRTCGITVGTRTYSMDYTSFDTAIDAAMKGDSNG